MKYLFWKFYKFKCGNVEKLIKKKINKICMLSKSLKAFNIIKSCKIFFKIQKKSLFSKIISFCNKKKEKENIKRKEKKYKKLYDLTPSGRD